jgi:aminoglycoside phosphotransferase (APT) family kinase protein
VNGACDRHLDERIVSALIAGQFPWLSGQNVTRFAAGWDNELFAVGDEWILRFPKRAGQVPWLIREIEIMRLAGEALGRRVPAFELTGRPGEEFPYPFVGYRRLPGVAADQVPASAGLAADIGTSLTALHQIDPARVPLTPAGWENEPLSALREELAEVAEAVRPRLPAALRDEAEPYLSGEVPEPRRDGPRRFIHNDIRADHLLADPRTGRLTGLIDFGDAMAGDPVLDFVWLVGIGGYEFIAAVIRHYGLPLGDGFQETLIWLARVLTLTWLAEAEPAAVPGQLRPVASAFERASPCGKVTTAMGR